MRRHVEFAVVALFVSVNFAEAQILNHQELLKRESFWDNRDFDWYSRNIPFFDCPDRELTTTYYYRWELLTKHLTYGSPNSGYSFTEFIDRPFWSGAYGAISCPAGLQLYEARWLRDPTIARDYVRYWFRTPGAQPRRYSTWLVDAAWAVHRVHPDSAFMKSLLPDFIRNDQEWEKRHFVPAVGLFWQTGHDDGMEYNINSRQTRDPNAGAPGFRPTLNSYMIADAIAIARTAELAGAAPLAEKYRRKAERLKAAMLDSLWDPKRQFFFHRFRDDEQTNGVKVEKNTLTHQSGKFAGSPFGRELHGYVPWQFDLPDERHVAMWKLLTDPQGFKAPFGPTTVERRDPMFELHKNCCWWSGQSWPYATSQTLKGLANALQRGLPLPITKRDYFDTLQTYSKTHRKNGRPYIAEACHPETGSWEGHDNYNHSEHYFHSNFCDLIVTGLVGLIPEDGDDFDVHPLAPDDWDYFALDDLRYRGHDVAIIFDRTGERYHRGIGLQVFIDGAKAASSPKSSRLHVKAPPTKEEPTTNRRRVNFAVNNDGGYFPRISATVSNSGQSLRKLIDGNYWYHQRPPNRWTFEGTSNKTDFITIDFGVSRTVDEARLYLLDDVDLTAPPERFTVECFHNGRWEAVSVRDAQPNRPEGRRANRVQFAPVTASRFRFKFVHRAGAPTGLTEIELWGDAEGTVSAAPISTGNLALRSKASASFTSRFDRVEEANDGVVNFNPEPRNRWTSYESPNKNDWVEFDLGSPQTFSRVELALYSDGRGVRAPKAHWIEIWIDGGWRRIADQARFPQTPIGGELNEVRFPPVTASKVRVVFEHALPGKSGVSEILIWRE
jgi:hypothetical protein